MDPKHFATMDTAAELTADRQLAVTVDSQPRHHGLILGRGALIGRYLVLGELGAGAMGVVYAAHDPDLDRKIALKLLKSNQGSPDARARLLREAQSMARLAHPNVIPVHDVGTLGDEVFVAMEFIQGVTLTRWLADKERGWREVLDVFIAAASGLKAVHDAGLIHRDLKPDNIMVGEDKRVRVMDFGIARADLVIAKAVVDAPLTDSSALQHLTNTGSLLGTPAYMAPEQWQGGAIDARADQFAYCVALWEGLYRERPFRGQTLSSLMLAVTSGRRAGPRDPKRAPSWLRRILERGLETKPELRWPSMDALLRELTRDRLAQTRRWLTACLGVALLATGFLGVKQVLDKRAVAAAEREQADIAHEEALRAVAVAEDRLSTANSAVERILSEVLPDLKYVPAGREVEKKIHVYLDELQEHLLPDARDDLSALRNRLTQHLQRGGLALSHDSLELARQELWAALHLAEQLAGRDPDSAYARSSLAVTLASLGMAERLARNLTTARLFTERSLSISEKLAEEYPQNVFVRLALSSTLTKLGDVEESAGNHGAARLLFERALSILEDMMENDPHNVSIQRHHYDPLSALARLEKMAGDLAAARVLLERNVEIHETLAQEDPQNVSLQMGLANSLRDLGELESVAGNSAAARALFLRATPLWEQLMEGDPHNFFYRMGLYTSLMCLRDLDKTNGDLAAARLLFLRALSLVEDDRQLASFGFPTAEFSVLRMGLGLGDLEMAAEDLAGLGDVEEAAGNLAVARLLFQRSRAIVEIMMEEDPHGADLRRKLSTALTGLGRVEEAAGDVVAARVLFESGLSINEEIMADDPQNERARMSLFESVFALGLLEKTTGNTTGSRILFERALSLSEEAIGIEPQNIDFRINLFDSLFALGEVEATAGDVAEPGLSFERALSVSTRLIAYDPDFFHVRMALSERLIGIGDVEKSAGNLLVARRLFERALSTLDAEAAGNPHDIDIKTTRFECHKRLGELSFEQKDLKGQRKHLAAADKLRAQIVAEGQTKPSGGHPPG